MDTEAAKEIQEEGRTERYPLEWSFGPDGSARYVPEKRYQFKNSK